MEMVVHMKRRWLGVALWTALAGVVCGLVLPWAVAFLAVPEAPMGMGGTVRTPLRYEGGFVPALGQGEELSSERFQRPSKALPYPNPYSFRDFKGQEGEPPKFEDPEELILAYYGILREASHLLGYWGGCGTVGESTGPYPYAYALLAEETRSGLSLERFEDSFRGIGYITLLKLIPAYTPADQAEHIRYYMVEIEAITGARMEEERQGGQFVYDYGIVTAVKTSAGGWKIMAVDYIPEDFLCAPTHSWFYLSDAVVGIVYMEHLKRIDQIDRTEREGDMVRIYGSGQEGSYRFDFVRITNGYDILLHEYVLEDGEWRETSLLTDGWESFKLTAESNALRQGM